MEEESTGQSKLFVILAVALLGLLILGLMGIGGVFVIRQNLREQAALSRPTPTLLIRLPNPTATFTPVKPAATNTPVLPTPTNTPVVAPGNDGEVAAVGGNPEANADAEQEGEATGPILKPQPRPTKASEGGATPAEVPNTGLGALEAVLIAMGLVFVLFMARRMRMSL
jgi:hypothetical protein